MLGSCVYCFFFFCFFEGVWKDVACVASRVYPKKNCLLSLPVSVPVFSLLDLVSSVSGRHVFSLCIIKRDPFLLKEMRVGWPWPHSLIYIWILERVAYIHTAVLHDLLFHTWYLVFTYGNILILPIALHGRPRSSSNGTDFAQRSDEAPQYSQCRRM